MADCSIPDGDSAVNWLRIFLEEMPHGSYVTFDVEYDNTVGVMNIHCDYPAHQTDTDTDDLIWSLPGDDRCIAVDYDGFGRSIFYQFLREDRERVFRIDELLDFLDIYEQVQML